jgi:hypothetical protein
MPKRVSGHWLAVGQEDPRLSEYPDGVEAAFSHLRGSQGPASISISVR